MSFQHLQDSFDCRFAVTSSTETAAVDVAKPLKAITSSIDIAKRYAGLLLQLLEQAWKQVDEGDLKGVLNP